MKLKHQSDRSLESFVLFPYIAWGVTILFAIFVYNLAVNLQETASRLEIQADALEMRVSTPVEQIEDFDKI